MFIPEIFATKKPVISFEVFPPNNKTKMASLHKSIAEMAQLKPDYISVTYGALGVGMGQNHTIEVASHIKEQYGIEPLVHLTCITADEPKIHSMLELMDQHNLHNVLALRGDLPQDWNGNLTDIRFPHAADLIGFLQQERDFAIGAACHPEGHMESASKTADLLYLREKVDRGADFLVSQLFFDNEDFLTFQHEVRSLGITVPITAGIMPVVNKRQIERITQLCGARVPQKFKRIMDRYEHNKEALRDAGIAYAAEQIIDLLSAGVSGVHLYVMNRPDIAKRLVGNIESVVKHLVEERETIG